MSTTSRPTADKTGSAVTDLGPIPLIGAVVLLPAASNPIVESRLIAPSVATAIVTLLVPILTKGSGRTITRRPFDSRRRRRRIWPSSCWPGSPSILREPAPLVTAPSASDRAIGLNIIDPAAQLHVTDGLIRPQGTMHHVYQSAAPALVAVAVALVATGDRTG